MKRFQITAKSSETIAYTTVNKTTSWVLEAQDEIAAEVLIKTREELDKWPVGTIWTTTEIPAH